MKRIIRSIAITCLVASCTIPALAQRGTEKIMKTMSRSFLESQPVSKVSKNVSANIYQALAETHASFIAHSSMAVPARPLTPVIRPVEPAPWRVYEPQPENVRTRSWLEQQERNIKAWQLKRQHAQELALYTQFTALPQLQGKRTFQVADLRDFSITDSPKNSIPALPVMEYPNYLYRVLGLNSNEDIRNILINGLRLQDVGSDSNVLLMMLASSPQKAATLSSSKYTNLTKSPETALHYALRNSNGASNRMAVIVIVNGEEQYGPIVQVQHDIPATQISAVIALLNIDGVPTWCRVQLREGEFVITPYENK